MTKFKTIIMIVLFLVVVVGAFGVGLPYLLSAKADVPVMIALVSMALIGTTAFVFVVDYVKKLFKKEDK